MSCASTMPPVELANATARLCASYADAAPHIAAPREEAFSTVALGRCPVPRLRAVVVLRRAMPPPPKFSRPAGTFVVNPPSFSRHCVATLCRAILMRPFGLSINVQRPQPRGNACPVLPPAPVAGVIALLMLIPMQSHVLVVLEPLASIRNTTSPAKSKTL